MSFPRSDVVCQIALSFLRIALILIKLSAVQMLHYTDYTSHDDSDIATLQYTYKSCNLCWSCVPPEYGYICIAINQ